MKKRKRIKRRFLFGIDTAHNKQFSYISFGPLRSIKKMEKDIKHLCLKNDVKKIHFNEIQSDKRKLIYPELCKIVLNYDSVNFVVWEHKRPINYQKKDFYFKFLPKEYRNLFDFLKHKDAIVRVHIHEDFNVSGVVNSTNYLMNCLIKKITKGFTDEPAIFRHKVGGTINSDIKCKETGKRLLFNIRSIKKQNSSAINIADIVLGFHQLKLKTKHRFFSETKLDNMFLRKVKYKKLIP